MDLSSLPQKVVIIQRRQNRGIMTTLMVDLHLITSTNLADFQYSKFHIGCLSWVLPVGTAFKHTAVQPTLRTQVQGCHNSKNINWEKHLIQDAPSQHFLRLCLVWFGKVLKKKKKKCKK